MHQSIIVHGPPGCGKTFNAVTIARHFGLCRIFDNQDPHALPPDISTNTLILTRVNLRGRAEVSGCRVLHYADAAAQAGVSQPTRRTGTE